MISGFDSFPTRTRRAEVSLMQMTLFSPEQLVDVPVRRRAVYLVTWRLGKRRVKCQEWPTERAARLFATCVLATEPLGTRVRVYDPAGKCIATTCFKEPKGADCGATTCGRHGTVPALPGTGWSEVPEDAVQCVPCKQAGARAISTLAEEGGHEAAMPALPEAVTVDSEPVSRLL